MFIYESLARAENKQLFRFFLSWVLVSFIDVSELDIMSQRDTENEALLNMKFITKKKKKTNQPVYTSIGYVLEKSLFIMVTTSKI